MAGQSIKNLAFAKALPAVVGVLSTLALGETLLTNRFLGWNYPSIAVSGFGIAASVAYFQLKSRGRIIAPAVTAFYWWALLQAVIITLKVPLANQAVIEDPYWNVCQFVDLHLGYSSALADGTRLGIYFNFFPFALFAWIHRLRAAESFL